MLLLFCKEESIAIASQLSTPAHCRILREAVLCSFGTSLDKNLKFNNHLVSCQTIFHREFTSPSAALSLPPSSCSPDFSVDDARQSARCRHRATRSCSKGRCFFPSCKSKLTSPLLKRMFEEGSWPTELPAMNKNVVIISSAQRSSCNFAPTQFQPQQWEASF